MSAEFPGVGAEHSVHQHGLRGPPSPRAPYGGSASPMLREPAVDRPDSWWQERRVPPHQGCTVQVTLAHGWDADTHADGRCSRVSSVLSFL